MFHQAGRCIGNFTPCISTFGFSLLPVFVNGTCTITCNIMIFSLPMTLHAGPLSTFLLGGIPGPVRVPLGWQGHRRGHRQKRAAPLPNFLVPPHSRKAMSNHHLATSFASCASLRHLRSLLRASEVLCNLATLLRSVHRRVSSSPSIELRHSKPITFQWLVRFSRVAIHATWR